MTGRDDVVAERLSSAVEAAAIASALSDTRAATPAEALALDPARAAVLRGVPDIEHVLAGLWTQRRARSGHLASVLGQAASAATGSTRDWADVGDEAMIAQGTSSALIATTILQRIAPAYGVLRGDDPARALDVGTGIGAIALALAEGVAALEVTGIDIAERPLELAGRRLAEAGSEAASRIRLRLQDVTALADEAAYDLVWMPIPFLPDRIVDAALARASAALRPGGLLVLGTRPDVADPRSAVAAAWLAELSGGGTLTTSEVERRVADLGHREIQRFATVPGGPVLLAARAA
ncbi:methyltransferase domain-containing protein [Cnuibacter physcomitrellae]|uniref:class I SAM-dependent methyltransferase n=1 Tax=Cnuibacter physcomitrellae TaxID=1619308 RepID=UPI0021758DFC|nr:class I SAM-dependent methyltransferase [Cnuibacter physcomitrellae]MCS5495635.1 methyltransferase domain-containing protein [Cnuibacter physcomitrellae]